ncbi:hypothetical protein B296_00044470 [Ensete ventricosum]|uniref:Chalcone/stilbene synthase N-terminal domain-containing protein n=1 Tax=Ensete ventricosum TaxID=4639 RepID=A0A426XC94_ENSVE|nr:hypothetical protein B296_00044470 [Ensete ventricosum]
MALAGAERRPGRRRNPATMEESGWATDSLVSFPSHASLLALSPPRSLLFSLCYFAQLFSALVILLLVDVPLSQFWSVFFVDGESDQRWGRRFVDSVATAQRAQGPATIMAIGTANPPNLYEQTTYPDYYFRVTNSGHKQDLKHKFRRMCKKTSL